MSAIVTITFNPCIDKSISVPVLIPEKKLVCSGPKEEPGGGGINVARTIRKLGGQATAIYPAGGHHGNLLTELLRQEGVITVPVPIQNHTRENWIVLETSSNYQYRFGMRGPDMSETEWSECMTEIEKIQGIAYLVVSGSLAPGIPENILEKIGIIANNKKAKLIVDTSGDPLKYALQCGAYLIKPNRNELNTLITFYGLDDSSITAAATDIVERKLCEIVVVSMGESGAVVVTENFAEKIKPPPVNKQSTVGAGDSMVAGIVMGLLNNKSIKDAVRYGVACGTAATLNPGTELCKLLDAENIFAAMNAKT